MTVYAITDMRKRSLPVKLRVQIVDHGPELRFTNSGKAVCTLRVHSSITNKNYDCEAWEVVGEDLANANLKPNFMLSINGYVKDRTYIDQEDQERTMQVFVIKEWSL
jgi:single-stranded DNA-binding protein